MQRRQEEENKNCDASVVQDGWRNNVCNDENDDDDDFFFFIHIFLVFRLWVVVRIGRSVWLRFGMYVRGEEIEV